MRCSLIYTDYMRYEHMTEGVFLSRPNRFIALVEIDGKTEKAHVKNTGRLKELLIPGAVVYLQDHADNMGKRKLRYSLIAVEKDGEAINIDSQAPNRIAEEALKNGKLQLPGMGDLTLIRPETKYGDSRFDFYLEDEEGKKAYMEVKGCTLNDHGTARFPDAPTERGIKHLHELMKAREEGYLTYVLFICAMKGVTCFTPNRERHPAFAEELEKASYCGVHLLCYDCKVSPEEILLEDPLPIILSKNGQ